MGNHIAVFDCISKNMTMLDIKEFPLKANRGYKFWSSIIYERNVYFIGHYYPAILKVNVDTYAVEYITEWVEELNAASKSDEPYFTGGIVVGDYAYIPSCCTNAILKLELSSGKTEVIYLDIDILGFNGIKYIENVFWLVARNSDTLVKWNEMQNSICKIIISEREGKDYLGFYEPLVYEKKILLAPIMSTHFYSYDIDVETIEIIDELEYVFNVDYIDECMSKDMVLSPCIKGTKFIFISGRDYKWHVWDVEKGTEVVYEILADAEMSKYIKYLPYYNLWNRYKNVDNLMLERANFSCKKFIHCI